MVAQLGKSMVTQRDPTKEERGDDGKPGINNPEETNVPPN